MGPPEMRLTDGPMCTHEQEEPGKRRCPCVILGSSSLKSILLHQQQSPHTDGIPALQHLFCCCFFQQVPGYLGSSFFFRKLQNRMSDYYVISWSGEISPRKALPAAPVPSVETKIKTSQMSFKEIQTKEGRAEMVWQVLKILFTHPHYSTLGTVAVSRLRTPSRLLTPLPLALINTEHFEVKKVWRLSQNQKSSFSFLSCPSFILIPVPHAARRTSCRAEKAQVPAEEAGPDHQGEGPAAERAQPSHPRSQQAWEPVPGAPEAQQKPQGEWWPYQGTRQWGGRRCWCLPTLL